MPKHPYGKPVKIVVRVKAAHQTIKSRKFKSVGAFYHYMERASNDPRKLKKIVEILPQPTYTGFLPLHNKIPYNISRFSYDE